MNTSELSEIIGGKKKKDNTMMIIIVILMCCCCYCCSISSSIGGYFLMKDEDAPASTSTPDDSSTSNTSAPDDSSTSNTSAPDSKIKYCYAYKQTGNDLKTIVYPASKTGGKCPDEAGATELMEWGTHGNTTAGSFMAYNTGTSAEKMCYTYANSGPDGLRTLVYPASKTGGKCPDEAGATQKMGWGFTSPNIGKGGYFYNKSTGTGPEICYTYNDNNSNTLRTYVTPKSTNNTCDYSSSGWGYTDTRVGSGSSFKSA